MKLEELKNATMDPKVMYDQIVAGKIAVNADTVKVLERDRRFKRRSFDKRMAAAAFYEILLPTVTENDLRAIGYEGIGADAAYGHALETSSLYRFRTIGIGGEICFDDNVFRSVCHVSKTYNRMRFDSSFLYANTTRPGKGAIGVWNVFAAVYGVAPLPIEMPGRYSYWLDDATLYALLAGRPDWIVPDERPGHEHRRATLTEIAAKVSELYLAGDDPERDTRPTSAYDMVLEGVRDVYGNLLEKA